MWCIKGGRVSERGRSRRVRRWGALRCSENQDWSSDAARGQG